MGVQVVATISSRTIPRCSVPPMSATIATIDIRRYRLLAATRRPKDVIVWSASTRPAKIAKGSPFLFALPPPHDAIVGFGTYAGFSVLPDWFVCVAFGDGVGVDGLGDLRAQIGVVGGGPVNVGCCMISEARFFRRDQWLARCDATRLWRSCMARVSDSPHAPVEQPIFHVQVIDAYCRRCAITGERSIGLLEATRIKSDGRSEVTNALAVRTDLRRLFEAGYVTVDEEMKFVVGRRLIADVENGRSYLNLHGKALTLPVTKAARPSRRALAWHRERVFVG